MIRVRLKDIHLHYGPQVLLDGVSLTISDGDKIGLLGRNGAGKTSLLKIIAGINKADQGECWVADSARIAIVGQSLPPSDNQSIYDYVALGIQSIGALLVRYQHLLSQQPVNMQDLTQVQQRIEEEDGWRLQNRVEKTLTLLDLPKNKMLSELSGGWRRRIALARALVAQPDLLILDEPTNHLDLPGIERLEQFMAEFRGAVLFVTHDRSFLQKIANRIIELDRGNLVAWKGDYQGFLRFSEQRLEAEASANAEFDKKLVQEETWIRQGIKARRTRNEGRVRALLALRKERSDRREKTGNVNFKLAGGSSSGKLVAELESVTHRYGDDLIIDQFSTAIMRGDRVGLVGANGVGKSTLLKLLLGQLEPTEGNIRLGTKLEVAYFDQLRGELDYEMTLIENVCGGRDFIEIDGRRQHAIGYLNDFLFAPERSRLPVKALSGGEQNRAILAKLFSKPSNLLVMDEPTNDLDIETLELLEELLLKYDGTLLLVSHDRAFMDNVVTSLLVFEKDGVISDHVGGYTDWVGRGGVLYEPQGLTTESSSVETTLSDRAGQQQKGDTRKPKLSFKIQRELDSLPKLIEGLENEQVQIEAKIAASDFYGQEHEVVNAQLQLLTDVQKRLEAAYQRWGELDLL